MNHGGSDPIPGRAKVLLSSIVFVAASTLLLLEFTSIGYDWPYDHTAVESWNWLGLWSCVGWFVGFALLIDWIVFSTFPVWGFDRQALVGAILKLIASVLFCIQPMSYICSGEQYLKDSYGTPWSNFVGICFFHAGNCINAVGMLKLIDCRAPLLASAPSIGMLIFAAATWFLVVADGLYYFGLPKPTGPGMDPPQSFVSPGQVTGATLLLVGSLLYTLWAATFGRIKEPEPLLRVQPLNAAAP